jgi:LacI family transcriptional regulator
MPTVLQTIADRMNVSVSTVSRVLNGDVDYARPFYAQRASAIQRLARELDYRPHPAAQAISRGRYGTLAVVAASQGRGGLPPHLVDGIGEAATRLGLMTTIARFDDDVTADRDRAAYELQRVPADGFLINFTHNRPGQFDAAVLDAARPYVWLNVQKPRNAVYFADRAAARDITARLIEIGHRRIALVAPDLGRPQAQRHYSSDERRDGYREALRHEGLDPVECTSPIYYGQNALDAPSWAELLSARDRPTALLVTGVHGHVMLAVALSLGLRVPRDLTIVSFERAKNIDANLPLVRLDVPQFELGARAVNLLHRAIEKKEPTFAGAEIEIVLKQEQFLAGPPANP